MTTPDSRDELLAQALCGSYNCNASVESFIANVFGAHAFGAHERSELAAHLAQLIPAGSSRTPWHTLDVMELWRVLNGALPGYTFAIANGRLTYRRAKG